jgi:hypothetical protein
MVSNPVKSIRLPIYPTADVLFILSDLSDQSGKATFGTIPHISATFVDIDKAIPNLLYRRSHPDFKPEVYPTERLNHQEIQKA